MTGLRMVQQADLYVVHEKENKDVLVLQSPSMADAALASVFLFFF